MTDHSKNILPAETEIPPDCSIDESKTAENHVSSATEPYWTVTDVNPKKTEYKVEIYWINVMGFIALHLWALYGLKLLILDISWLTVVWFIILGYVAGIGITLGAHRLWCHRAYNATTLLKLFLFVCNCVTFQNSIFDWTRNHRVHHKYSETDADPYNAKRGFFFCHLGWLMCKKHPDVTEKGQRVDLSDLRNDRIVMFQKRWYLWLGAIYGMYLPAAVPHYLWGEDILNGFFVCFGLRYIIVLHAQCYINSGAHLWGDRPYDKDMNPAENYWATIFGLGEAFHNFHHTFPWDYSASEWGWKANLSTLTLDIFARLGLAYNLKKVPQEVINRRRELNGDGSKPWYPEILYPKEKVK